MGLGDEARTGQDSVVGHDAASEPGINVGLDQLAGPAPSRGPHNVERHGGLSPGRGRANFPAFDILAHEGELVVAQGGLVGGRELLVGRGTQSEVQLGGWIQIDPE
jgi:hypothetical protein